LDGAAQLNEFFCQSRTFRFRFCTAQRRCGMFVLRAFRALPRILHFLPDARKFVLANRQLQAEPS
jgi:hypothetical protein